MRRWLFPAMCGLLQVVSVSTGNSDSPGTLAAVLYVVAGVGAGLALVVRQSAPMLVLGVAVVGEVTQVLLAGPAVPVVATVATYVVAKDRLVSEPEPSPRWGPFAALAGSVLVIVVAVSTAGDPDLAAPVALLLTLSVLAGLAVAVRDARVASHRRELLAGERLRIAQDLHDTLGHGITAITMQAGAGRIALAAGSPADATTALLTIEEAGRRLLRETRWTLGDLRRGAGTPSFDELPELVAMAGQCGIDVALRTSGDVGQLFSPRRLMAPSISWQLPMPAVVV